MRKFHERYRGRTTAGVGDAAEKMPDSVRSPRSRRRPTPKPSARIPTSSARTCGQRDSRRATFQLRQLRVGGPRHLGGQAVPVSLLANNAALKIYGDVLVNQDAGCVSYDHATLLYHTLTTSSGAMDPFSSPLPAPSSAGMPALGMPCMVPHNRVITRRRSRLGMVRRARSRAASTS